MSQYTILAGNSKTIDVPDVFDINLTANNTISLVEGSLDNTNWVTLGSGVAFNTLSAYDVRMYKYVRVTAAADITLTIKTVIEKSVKTLLFSSNLTFSLPMDGSGLANLEQALTINGQTVSPTFRYEAKNATTGTWTATVGEDLTGAGTGGTVGLDTPFISDDEAVNGEGTRYWQAGNTTFGDVSTEDIVIEAVFAGGTTAINGRLISKYQSPAGWTLLQANPSAVTLYIKGTAGANVASQVGGVVPGVWNHIIIFCDKSGSGQMYLNGAASGAAASLSSVGSVAQTMTNLTVAADPNGVNKHDATLAYAAMWQRDNWLDTHLQEDIAKERFYKLSGIYPEIAKGTALPESYTRATTAFLDKEVIGVRSLFQVGAGYPRVCSRTDSEGALVTGYLSETASTNLILYSQDFSNPAWTPSNATVTANVVSAPDGTTTADTLVENGVGPTTHYVAEIYASTPGTYTASIWAKAANRSWLQIRLASATDGTSTVSFDLSTGAVGTESANDAAGIEAWGDGWFRCWVKDTRATAESQWVYLYAGEADNDAFFTGLSQDSLYLWGAQVEEDVGHPSSYIPTSGSAATRAADVLYFDGTLNITNNQQGTMVCNVLMPDYDQSKYMYALSLSDGGSANDTVFLATNAADTFRFYGRGGAVTQWDYSTGVVDPSSNTKLNVRGTWDASDVAAYIDGAEEGTPVAGPYAPPDDLDRIHVGASYSGIAQLNGLISSLRLFKKPTLK